MNKEASTEQLMKINRLIDGLRKYGT